MKAPRHDARAAEPSRDAAAAQASGPHGEAADALQASPHLVAQREAIRSAFGPAAQRKNDASTPDNRTGMPDDLKSGIESLSGMDLSDVRVRTNSGLPGQLQAHAVAQGNEIHLAPGQEAHLPHEAWHVVQQRQGRVKPTTTVRGAPINDDESLEREADVRGAQALQRKPETAPGRPLRRVATPAQAPVQRFPANVLTHSFNWAGPMVVTPMGGGAMAALYRLDQNPVVPPGGVGSVVVKALEVDEPDSVRFGEAYLRQVGFATPDDRIIMPADPEFAQLANRLLLNFDAVTGQFMAGNKPVGGLLLMQNLAALGATTIQSKMMSATTQAEVDEVFAWMTDPVVLNAVGRSTVYDTAIGNFDRITLDAQNFGNLMIRRGAHVATQVFLIDTNARLPRIEQKLMAEVERLGGFYEERVMNSKLLTNLFAHRDWAVGNWFDALPAMVQAQQNKTEEDGGVRSAPLDALLPYITNRAQVLGAASAPLIQAAIDQALIDLRAMMSNKLDPRRVAIKAAATGTQSFDNLKAQAGYLDQRSRPPAAVGGAAAGGDIGHAGATSIVATYGRYKVAKAVAGLPVNAAANPAMHQALVVPVRLRASKAEQVLKGKGFKALQTQDFAAFNPLYQAFCADMAHHQAYLGQLSTLLDNTIQLRSSLAEPGSTRNARAMVSLQKRTAQCDRLVNLLRPAVDLALQWAATYSMKSAALVGELDEVTGGRYDNLRAQAPVLRVSFGALQQVRAKVAAQRLHIN